MRVGGRGGLRPAALVAAVLAPAVLAVGLLVAELTDYGVKTGRGAFSVSVERVDEPQVMGPVRVPGPARPERVYEGEVPGPRGATAEARPMPLQAAPMQRREARPARTASPEVAPTCPAEWSDTWLWELCLEDAQRPA
ncbi:hypothetical protein GCM10009556_046560 [Acrocarpospora pleiomorpha]